MLKQTRCVLSLYIKAAVTEQNLEQNFWNCMLSESNFRRGRGSLERSPCSWNIILECNYKLLTKVCHQSKTNIVDKQNLSHPSCRRGCTLPSLCATALGALPINQIGCIEMSIYIYTGSHMQLCENIKKLHWCKMIPRPHLWSVCES